MSDLESEAEVGQVVSRNSTTKRRKNTDKGVSGSQHPTADAVDIEEFAAGLEHGREPEESTDGEADDDEIEPGSENGQRQSVNSRKLTTCAEAGVIESVSLVDFMCHENLSIDLGPNMNFIIGHNGSGKSAILTAITGELLVARFLGKDSD